MLQLSLFPILLLLLFGFTQYRVFTTPPPSPLLSFSQHLNFEKSYNLQFPLLSDIGANVADLYGSKLDIPFMGKFANRLTFIIGSDGKIEKVPSICTAHIPPPRCCLYTLFFLMYAALPRTPI